MTFLEYPQGGTGTQTLSGIVNGTNTLFTLPVTPVELQVYRNGLFQLDRATGITPYDFQWATSTITFSSGSIPQPGDQLIAWVFES
jgi:hypothetical protein